MSDHVRPMDWFDVASPRAAVAVVVCISEDERSSLASMRDELLQDDLAYWHNDQAIRWLNSLIGDAYPPFRPDGV